MFGEKQFIYNSYTEPVLTCSKSPMETSNESVKSVEG